MLIKHLTAKDVGTTIDLQGRIVHIRSSGKVAFIELRDGTGFLQCVIEPQHVGEKAFEELKTCGIESAIAISGTLAKHPKKDEFELQSSSVSVLSKSNDYPLGQKEHNPEFLFDNRHLYLRSKSQRAIQRIRDTVIHATYDWMRNHDFIKIDSPILTPNACEGTTELYEVEHVNGKKMYLTQSGQLYIEAAIFAHRQVYDFGPCFRAEECKTRRHLNELRMMDAEMAFVDFHKNMEVQEQLIYYIVQKVLKKNKLELQILERDTTKLEKITLPFPRKKHRERIAELQKLGFDVKKDEDVGSELEMKYCENIEQPFFLTHFPIATKAFYVKEDKDHPGYALCNDLLIPEGCGEIISGSQREDDLETLERRIKEHNLPADYFARYNDLRKYGSVEHSGFGYGLERIVRRVCGVHHIRECIPFPRYANRITP